MQKINNNTKIYIYGLYDPIDQIIKYVGWTHNPKYRLTSHIYEANNPEKVTNPHTHKNAWIRKILYDGRKPGMYILEENIFENRDEREKYWIKRYGRENLTNGTDGGTDSKWEPNKYSQIPVKNKIKRDLKVLTKKRTHGGFDFISKMCFGKDFNPNDNLILTKHRKEFPDENIYCDSDGEYLKHVLEQYFLNIENLCKMLSLRNLQYYYELFKDNRFGYELGPENDLPNLEMFIEYYLVDENGYYDDNLENHKKEDEEWIKEMLLDVENE